MFAVVGASSPLMFAVVGASSKLRSQASGVMPKSLLLTIRSSIRASSA